MPSPHTAQSASLDGAAEAEVSHLAPEPRAARPCVILNARSFRASIGDLAEAARALARRRGAEIIEASEPAQLAAALNRVIDTEGESIAVLAGDGTVQAIADHLAGIPDPLRRPALLVLAGGRTNLIAADFRGRGEVLRKLRSHLDRLAAGASGVMQGRTTLVIEQDPAPARHGFFLAGAQVDSTIRACHAHRAAGNTALHIGHLADPYCLLKLALARIGGRSALPAMPTLQITAEGLGELRCPTRLFAVSTLTHAGSIVNPFAERGSGALRLTAVAGAASGFWWRLPRVLLGRFTSRMNPEHGYLSGRCERLEVLGLERYTLDGEKFETDPTRPVVIRRGPTLRFIVP